MGQLKKLLDNNCQNFDIDMLCGNEIPAARAIVQVLIDNNCTITQTEDIFSEILRLLKSELIISDNFTD